MDASMTFALILTVVIIGFVLAFGMGQVGDLFCMSGDAQVGKAISDLEAISSEVYNLAEGSSRVFRVSLSGDYKLCFVNKDSPGIQLYPSAESWKNWQADPVFESMIKSKGYNIWYKMCSGQGGKAVPYIKVEKSFCASGGNDIYLENKGLWVEASA